jgi:thiamine biosynthesis lipoprotein
MRITCRFDSVRAIGFRRLFAAVIACSGIGGTARAEWITQTENIMGTRCSVELWSEDRQKGEAAIASVFADMHRIDRLMSTWKEDTEISRVNREAGKHPVRISPELFRLLQVSVEYSELTHGAFDITYASVGYLYDFKKGVHPDQKAIEAALPGINFRHMQLDPQTSSVSFTRPGMRIDLGGIAKGHSVDRGIEILRKQGITRAMVNAGGDTRIIGDRFGKPWVVGVRDPDHEG